MVLQVLPSPYWQGTAKDTVVLQRKAGPEPFGLTRFSAW
jgi:hypothetical protein